MKRIYAAMAVTMAGGLAWIAPARAVPPTVTPSPGYDARLQESRTAPTVYQPPRALSTLGIIRNASTTARADRRLAALGLARRRREQLLQPVQPFRKPRPFARERIFRAVRRLRPPGRQRHSFRFAAHGFAAERDRLQLLHLLLFCGKGRRDAVAPLFLEIDRVLLVDVLLLFRRRIRARDVEGPVLHEIVIGVAAARLAAAGEFRVAFGERRGPLFLGSQLLRDVGTCFEIDGAAGPPLGVRVRRLQHHEGARRSNEQRGYARSNHLRLSPARFRQHNCRGLLPFWGRLQPRNRTIFRSGSRGFFLTQAMRLIAPQRAL